MEGREEHTLLPMDSKSRYHQWWPRQDIDSHPSYHREAFPSSVCPCSVLKRWSAHAHPKRCGKPTWRTKIANVVFSPSLPSSFCAACTSFCNSRTAYSNVVRVSSTSSTIKTLFPIRFAISRELRSSHCVRVTFVPGVSTTPPLPRSS